MTRGKNPLRRSRNWYRELTKLPGVILVLRLLSIPVPGKAQPQFSPARHLHPKVAEALEFGLEQGVVVHAGPAAVQSGTNRKTQLKYSSRLAENFTGEIRNTKLFRSATETLSGAANMVEAAKPRLRAEERLSCIVKSVRDQMVLVAGGSFSMDCRILFRWRTYHERTRFANSVPKHINRLMETHIAPDVVALLSTGKGI